MKNYLICIGIAALILTVLIIFAGLEGCASLPQVKPPFTPGQQWNRTIVQIGWLPTVAIIGCAISIMAFINGSKSALGAFAGCIAALGLSLATVKFATVIAVVGGLGALAAFIYSVFLKDQALKEIVETVEVARSRLSNSSDEVLFSSNLDSYIRDTIQSLTTTKLVKKIKEKL